MNGKVGDLRGILFETIRAVKDGSMPLDRARVVGELTQVVVNSAKVEVAFIAATNGKGVGTGFLGEQPARAPARRSDPPVQPGQAAPALPPGITGVRQYRISDEEPEGED